jgi:hypothetical protein
MGLVLTVHFHAFVEMRVCRVFTNCLGTTTAAGILKGTEQSLTHCCIPYH